MREVTVCLALPAGPHLLPVGPTAHAAGGRPGGVAGSAGKQITTGKEKTRRTLFHYLRKKVYQL